jgi:fido (protein-threonine AMPylation protein)
LLADAHAWIEYQSYLPDEIAVGFHHGLVQIHPFLNGNGRHVRLTADLLVMRLAMSGFSWARESLLDAGIVRRRYIAALQAADHPSIAPLLLLARS